MDAIRNDYSSCRAGVEAIKAGCDMIMKPGNFRGSVNAVIKAVENGEISEIRINESVNRILRTFYQICRLRITDTKHIQWLASRCHPITFRVTIHGLTE